MAGVVSKFFVASMFMWMVPIAILYGFNHNLFPVNVVIGFYIYMAMKEPSEKHKPDPKFLAEAQASVKRPGDASEGHSQQREKEE